MDHNFYNNDFEAFLKQKADQYKMYPSDRVWNNIYSSLHGRRKWLILFFTLLFVSSSLYIGRQAVLSNYSRMATQINNVPETSFSMIKQQVPSTVSLQDFIPAGSRRMAENSQAASYPVITTTSVNDTIAALNNRFNTTRIISAMPSTGVADAAITTTTEGEVSVINNTGVLTRATPPAIILDPKKQDADVTANDQPTRKEADSADVTKTVAPENGRAVAIPQYNATAVKLAKPSKLFLQFYASPVISYRRLYNESRPGYTSPVSSIYGDNINQYVHHKPAVGFEAGSKIQYRLSNNLGVYVGAQLNYSRYYVDAYKFRVEKASIALSDSRFDTLSGYTDIRNFSGYSPEQLQNQYWQVSIPVGVEIKLLGNKKLQLGVAGGIQPTFLFHSNSYLISSDYKNYIQSPDMARTFNIHTSFEAFVSYQTGGIKWQLGPQFRSQLLSSYSNQYRVREYLTEFGIKLGITKTLK